MIYLEIATSVVIFIFMAYMSAIGTAYLSIKEKDIDLEEIIDKNKLKKLKYIFKNSSLFVSSVKSGISFLSLWLGALIVEIVANPIYKSVELKYKSTLYIFKYIVILLTAVILAYFLYIFAEIIPKSFAIKNKKKIVLKTINFVYIIAKVFSPVNKFAKKTEHIIMKISNIERKNKIAYKDAEVKETVEIAKEQGTLSKKDSLIISNFLKLDEMTVKDIMINLEDVALININSPKIEIKDKIINSIYTRIPVYDEDIRNVVGIINIKHVLKNILKVKSTKEFSTKKIVQPCMYVSSGKRLDLLFAEMKNNKEHMAIVVKEKNMAIGIVTMEDILEEIVGNIEDDFEKYKNS